MANDGAMENVDLDVFLTTIESKLRAPFSSLELSRAISTASSPTQYLTMIGQVLSRMDKVVQLRLLIGLLGVERTSNELEEAMYSLLQEAQDQTLYEEWTRVAAGLVQGILFSSDTENRNVGKEATQVLIKACGGQDAKKLLQQEAQEAGEEFDESKLKGILDQNPATTDSKDAIDMNPLFAPFYYSLVNPDTLEQILPDCLSNPHFTVNKDADILHEDERREREEQTAAVPAATGRALEEAAPAAALPPVIMPGRKSTTTSATKPKPRAPAAKSSMFMPSRKPTAMVGGRLGRQNVNARKPVQHTRKAGAAQKLLGKSRQLGQKPSVSSVGGGIAGTTTTGRSVNKLGNARSKMKMIDVSEVSELTLMNKERQEREQSKETQEQKISAKKRKIMEAAAAKGLVGTNKKSKPNGEAAQPPAAAVRPANVQPSVPMPSGGGRLGGRLAQLVMQHQQEQYSQQSGNTMPSQPPPAAPTGRLAPGKQEELDLLLANSNKLTDENRIRVKQFWIDRYNPTPEMPVVRMKLHEEKSVDETGMTVKNTDYLELDYNTFGYKKLRKTKKK